MRSGDAVLSPVAAANAALDAAQLAVDQAFAIEGREAWPHVAEAVRARSAAWSALGQALGTRGQNRHLCRAVFAAAIADRDLAAEYVRWIDAADEVLAEPPGRSADS